ncbi:MAG: sigma factor-like helix-turn-helix DNA-binding protein [Candidatus Methanospirareceae archaeon]
MKRGSVIPQLNDREWLYKVYYEEGKTQKEIAKMLGCAQMTVSKAMKRLGIPTRTSSESLKGIKRSKETRKKISEGLKKYPYLYNEKLLRFLYWEVGLTYREIADLFGCSVTPVQKALQEFSLKPRDAPEVEIVENKGNKDKNEIFAYLAGIVDGEGSIRLHRRRRKSIGYGLEVVVTNTNRELIDWLYTNFKGYIEKHEREGNHKTTYKWTVRGINAYRLLKKMLPYLIIKKPQAELGIKFWNECSRVGKSYGGFVGGRPKWLLEKTEEYARQMRELNKRGRGKR